jgi:hypothetical protein
MKIPVLSFLFLLDFLSVKSAAPPNDNCFDAIEIDATSDIAITGDTTGATLDYLPFGWCGTHGGNGVWYKIKDNFETKTAITLSTCNEIDSKISVLKGKNCDYLICVGGVDDAAEDICGVKAEYTFLASEHEPIYYYVYVSDWGEAGKYELKVHTNSSYFNVIDARNDRFVEVLNDFIIYWDPSTSSLSDKLNLQAVFSSQLSVKSVRVQFDDRASHCEGAEPYAVFGDKKGNYYGESLSIGPHTVSATPFIQERCKGPPGTPMVKDFVVDGCDLYGTIYDVKQDIVVDEILGDYDAPSLPCKVNVEAIPYCHFEVSTVRLVMREKDSNKIIHDITEHQRPYFLFGNHRDDVNAGSISAGNYTITTFINGIEHVTINFNVGNDHCT